MSSQQPVYEPSHRVLQQLNRLEQSSPDFPNQLTSIFSTKEYKNPDLFPELESEDKAWLIEHLENVCVSVSLYPLHAEPA